MHAEVSMFFCLLQSRWPQFFSEKRVIEIGSANVNGTVRGFFPSCQYIGVDHRAVEGVDWVGLGSRVPKEWDETFDVCVSTECLEHDPYWSDTVKRMVDLIKPEGAIFLTFADPARRPHEEQNSPVPGYYDGRTATDILQLLEGRFKIITTETDLLAGDVRVACVGKR